MSGYHVTARAANREPVARLAVVAPATAHPKLPRLLCIAVIARILGGP
jgi:hypothetical protein